MSRNNIPAGQKISIEAALNSSPYQGKDGPTTQKPSIGTVLNSLHYKSNRLQQIRGFCNVMVLGSITKAARAMGLTQPAVTAQVKSLERDLGKVLFSRRGKSLVPTKDGLNFYDFVAPTLHKVDCIYEEYLVRSDYLKDNNLTIVGYNAAIGQCLPAAIGDLLSKEDDINVNIVQINERNACIEALRQDTADIAICNRPAEVPGDLLLLKTIQISMKVLCPEDHPLTKLKRLLTWEDLQQYPFLHVNYNPEYQDLLTRHKIGANIRFSNCNWELLWRFVRYGAGITLSTVEMQDGMVPSGTKSIDAHHLLPDVEYQVIISKRKQKTALQKLIASFESVPKTFTCI